jgi:hypothetical protein
MIAELKAAEPGVPVTLMVPIAVARLSATQEAGVRLRPERLW